jgi:toxin ParE1/3/4
MRLRWTTPAAQDLYNIVLHIQQDNPAAANKVAQTLYDACDRLENFPRRGRKGRLEGTRELVFAGLPYIVVYRIQDQDLEILRIYHGAQNWP